MLKQKILGTLTGIIYHCLSRSWRYKIVYHQGLSPLPLTNKKLSESIVIGHWHGDELALIGHAGVAPFLTITSESKDGSIMNAALKAHGDFTTTRGSSTRGGVKALIALMKEIDCRHYFISFATDGPKGPIHKAKPGFYSVAKKKNLKAVQCLVECDHKWSFPNSWNQTYLPKPFARIKIHYYPLPSATQVEQEEFLQVFNSRIDVDKSDNNVIEVPFR